jgi:hypothetical protein
MALKEEKKLHLFTTRTPCGDSSMIECKCEENISSDNTMFWTGAKPISGDPKDQGISRLKPGRSDLPAEC